MELIDMNKLPEVLLLHNLPDTSDNNRVLSTFGAESGEGVLEEVNVVRGGLDKLGCPYRVAGVRRLSDVPMVLASAPEPVVWNLVEGLIGDPQDPSHVPALCGAYGKMSTGCDSPCLSLTLDKWRTKAVLREAGIVTPAGMVVHPGDEIQIKALGRGPFIIKPAESDASEGISSKSVFPEYCPQMEEIVRTIHRDFEQSALIEQYVGSREFNISIIQDGNDVRVMPLAEIDFSAFEPGKARIIDYAAKWLPDSFEYNNTPRVLPANISPDIADRIRSVALKSWRALDCRDFVRVDMRMDEDGTVYVIEINANPDISPDAGFAAALAAGSVSREEFIRVVVSNAGERLRHNKVIQRRAVPGDSVQGAFTVRRTKMEDRDRIIAMTEDTGYFRPDEIAVACEVLDDALLKGSEGHYQSFTAESGGEVAGWVCFGPTPCTLGTFDIYWIVVSSAHQRRGIGSLLMKHAEEIISARDGRLSVIETSGKGLYDSTRDFYNKMGYLEQARIAEFYAVGDDKIIYTKKIAGA